MSLDVYLTIKDARLPRQGSGIFIHENGSTREISREEWEARRPGCEPVVVRREGETDEVYTANITHNLNRMADAAGIYQALWRPDEIGITQAHQLIGLLEKGLATLRAEPERFRQFNPENGGGSYEGLVEFVANYLAACRKYPEAEVTVWR